MGNTPLSPELARQAVDAVNAAIRGGFVLGGSPSAITEAARVLGVHEKTLYSRVRVATKRDGLELDKNPPPPEIEFTAPAKPRVRVPAWTQDMPLDGPITRVLGIGDVHAKPGRSTLPVKLAGRHAAATEPHHIVQIGDWLSLDSCSMHPPKGSYRDHDRPSFSQDIEAAEESLEAFDRECPAHIPRTITYGNHEWRAWRKADADPKMCDDFPLRVEQAFARYRWKTVPYGQFFYLNGVGFVHVPLNAMGREYGGKHSENTIGNDATHSIVWGHDHKGRYKTLAKIGFNNRITLVNLGTCMPDGTVEDYNVGNTGWTYGVWSLTLQAGLITAAKFYSMSELTEMYGDA